MDGWAAIPQGQLPVDLVQDVQVITLSHKPYDLTYVYRSRDDVTENLLHTLTLFRRCTVRTASSTPYTAGSTLCRRSTSTLDPPVLAMEPDARRPSLVSVTSARFGAATITRRSAFASLCRTANSEQIDREQIGNAANIHLPRLLCKQ